MLIRHLWVDLVNVTWGWQIITILSSHIETKGRDFSTCTSMGFAICNPLLKWASPSSIRPFIYLSLSMLDTLYVCLFDCTKKRNEYPFSRSLASCPRIELVTPSTLRSYKWDSSQAWDIEQTVLMFLASLILTKITAAIEHQRWHIT